MTATVVSTHHTRSPRWSRCTSSVSFRVSFINVSLSGSLMLCATMADRKGRGRSPSPSEKCARSCARWRVLTPCMGRKSYSGIVYESLILTRELRKPRPLQQAPHSGALPSCATSREGGNIDGAQNALNRGAGVRPTARSRRQKIPKLKPTCGPMTETVVSTASSPSPSVRLYRNCRYPALTRKCREDSF